jgi:hypothetical protein
MIIALFHKSLIIAANETWNSDGLQGSHGTSQPEY